MRKNKNWLLRGGKKFCTYCNKIYPQRVYTKDLFGREKIHDHVCAICKKREHPWGYSPDHKADLCEKCFKKNVPSCKKCDLTPIYCEDLCERCFLEKDFEKERFCMYCRNEIMGNNFVKEYQRATIDSIGYYRKSCYECIKIRKMLRTIGFI